MTNPIDVERRFQDLLLALSLPSSPRQRLTAIDAFIVSLGGDLLLFEPYVLDLAQRVPGIVQHFQADGLPPDDLRSIYGALFRLPHVFQEVHTIAGYDECLKMLRDFTAFQYAFVGMLAESLALYGLALPETIETLSERSPLDRLRQTLNEAKARKHASALPLARLLDAWGAKLSGSLNHAIIPVVEKSLTSNEGVLAGRLRGVTVQLFAEAKKGNDDIRLDVLVLENGHDDFLKQAVLAARTLLSITHPSIARRFVSGRITFDGLNALHEGSSASLAIASLLYCELLRSANQRSQFRLATNAAFTGGINQQGAVLEVDLGSLEAKVEAAFFSWIEVLVLPRSQLVDARGVLTKLTAQYPNRQIVLLGADHLRDVFYERRLTDLKVTNALAHAALSAWKRKFVVGGFATALLMLLFIGYLLYGPIDKEPVSFQKSGEVLVIQNKYGERITEIDVGDPNTTAAVFCDVDNDGSREVIYGCRGNPADRGCTVVRCTSLVRDSVLWEYRLTQDRPLPNQYDSKNLIFRCRGLAVRDLGPGLGLMVIGVAVNDYSPCLVFQLAASNGAEIGKYYHYGHLNGPVLVDLDRDGLNEVLLAGVNGWRDEACIVVLDPRDIRGFSLLGKDLLRNTGHLNLEKYYIRIPTTILGRYFQERFEARYNLADIEGVNELERTLQFLVRDVHLNSGQAGASIYLHFSFEMKPIKVRPGDNYYSLSHRLFQEGKIDFVPDESYFKEYQKNFRYWNGEAWSPQPTINRNDSTATAKAALPMLRSGGGAKR